MRIKQKNMELKNAIDVLIRHNKWRRDKTGKLQQEHPKTIGEAIDVVVSEFERIREMTLLSVDERYLHINDAASLIKSMPTDQAIQKIKALLSGQPETTVIDGELLVCFRNAI